MQRAQAHGSRRRSQQPHGVGKSLLFAGAKSRCRCLQPITHLARAQALLHDGLTLLARSVEAAQ